jgi:hypothetical protein
MSRLTKEEVKVLTENIGHAELMSKRVFPDTGREFDFNNTVQFDVPKLRRKPLDVSLLDSCSIKHYGASLLRWIQLREEEKATLAFTGWVDLQKPRESDLLHRVYFGCEKCNSRYDYNYESDR